MPHNGPNNETSSPESSVAERTSRSGLLKSLELSVGACNVTPECLALATSGTFIVSMYKLVHECTLHQRMAFNVARLDQIYVRILCVDK